MAERLVNGVPFDKITPAGQLEVIFNILSDLSVDFNAFRRDVMSRFDEESQRLDNLEKEQGETESGVTKVLDELKKLSTDVANLRIDLGNLNLTPEQEQQLRARETAIQERFDTLQSKLEEAVTPTTPTPTDETGSTTDTGSVEPEPDVNNPTASQRRRNT